MSEGTRARGRLMPAPFAMPRSVLALLVGRAAVCAGGRRPAREPSAPRASLGTSSRSPARPRHRPRAPRPCPAAAHGHRGQALLRPSHRRCSRNLRLSLLLAAPLVFRAPSGPAAREIATRELCSEWSISKPARALRSLRCPPHRRRCVAVCGWVRRLEARPGSAIARGHWKSFE